MFQLIGKSLMIALAVPIAALPQVPRDPVCYDYYLKMRDLEFGSREYVTQRNKVLELKCGAFRRPDPEK